MGNVWFTVLWGVGLSLEVDVPTRVHMLTPALEHTLKQKLREAQFDHFRRGDGVLVNIHVTHHAGTQVCGWLTHYLGSAVPPKACLPAKTNDPQGIMELLGRYGHAAKDYEPQQWLDLGYRAVSFEFQTRRTQPKNDWKHVNFIEPKLLTLLVMRDPIERLLAGDGRLAMYGPNPDRRRALNGDERRRRTVVVTRTATAWDEYALHSYYADNYALRILGDRTDDVDIQYNISIPWNVPQQNLRPDDVVDADTIARAKLVVQGASVVIDQACLAESLQRLAERLNFFPNGTRSEFKLRPKREHASARQRVGNDTLYDLLVARNRYDIELYHWSKKHAIVHCPPLIFV